MFRKSVFLILVILLILSNFNVFNYEDENYDNMTINNFTKNFSNDDQNRDTSESDIIRNPVNNLRELSGDKDERSSKMIISSDGYLFIIGYSSSDNYPTTENAFQRYKCSETDIIWTVIDPENGNILYSTYLGGSEFEVPRDIIVVNDSIFITGYTYSEDFPVTEDAFSKSFSGDYYNADIFLIEFYSSNFTLKYSTYIGGSGSDIATSLCYYNDNLYITGSTGSTDFPVNSSAVQNVLQGPRDSILIEFSLDLHTITYSTYYGGNNCEFGKKILALQDKIYIIGETNSNDFPVYSGHISSQIIDMTTNNIFIAVFEIHPVSISFSTMIGGDTREYIGDAIYHDGSVYIVGRTDSSNFPITEDAIDRSFNQINSDGFILKVDSNVTVIQFSTYLGGSDYDECNSVIINSDGNIVVSGSTASDDFFIIKGANDVIIEEVDVFVTSITQNPYRITYSTFIGGEKGDAGIQIIQCMNKYILLCNSDSTRIPLSINEVLTNVGTEHINIFNLTLSLIPDPPNNVAIDNYPTHFNITWDPPSFTGNKELIYYKIYKQNDGNNISFKINPDTLFYIDSNVTAEESYSYFITSVTEDGESTNSEIIEVTFYTVPSQPICTIRALDKEIQLYWGRPDQTGGRPVIGYNIYKGTSPDNLSFIKMVYDTTDYYNDYDVINGICYYYIVTAFNAIGESNKEIVLHGTPLGLPNRPQIDSITNINNSVSLSWNFSELYLNTINGIRIYRSYDNLNFIQIDDIDKYCTTFIDYNCSYGTDYYYGISTYNHIGESELSYSFHIIFFTNTSEPREFRVIGKVDSIEISWEKPLFNGGRDVIEYTLYKGESIDNMIFLASFPGYRNNYIDTDVRPGKMYYYYLTANNSFGDSPRTRILSNFSITISTPPAIMAYSQTQDSIYIEWSSDSLIPEIREFKIYRAVNDGEFELFKVISLNDSSRKSHHYYDDQVLNGNNYSYRITAVYQIDDSEYESDFSESIHIFKVGVPEKIDDLNYIISKYYILLSWNPPSNTGGRDIICYNIYISEDNQTFLRIRTEQNHLNYSLYPSDFGNPIHIRITSNNSLGESYKPLSRTIILETTPGMVNNFSVKYSNGAVKISWSTPFFTGGKKIIQYKIFRGINDGELEYYQTIDSDLVEFIDENISKNNIYRYAVIAVNAIGDGEPSQELQVRIGDEHNSNSVLWIILPIILLLIFIGVILFIVFKIKRSHIDDNTISDEKSYIHQDNTINEIFSEEKQHG